MSNRVPLTRAQADFLAKLKADAERAAAFADRALDVFHSALNGIALAVGDKGGVTFDFGPDPWIEVTPAEQPEK